MIFVMGKGGRSVCFPFYSSLMMVALNSKKKRRCFILSHQGIFIACTRKRFFLRFSSDFKTSQTTVLDKRLSLVLGCCRSYYLFSSMAWHSLRGDSISRCQVTKLKYNNS